MVSKFVSGLLVKDDGDGTHMELKGAMVYQSARLNSRVKVPNGFVTDFASIPRALWAIIPKHGRYDRATVVHDYLYQFGGYVKDNGLVPITRADADAVLNEAMAVTGVGRLTRWAITAGVRAGGWVAWKNYRDGK